MCKNIKKKEGAMKKYEQLAKDIIKKIGDIKALLV
jgi:hypothetical protein